MDQAQELMVECKLALMIYRIQYNSPLITFICKIMQKDSAGVSLYSDAQ
jgi:hypothetical protein